jgi:Xaa-Pro aminopeptidase
MRKIVANIDRLNHWMDREGLSAIVARSGMNFTYLAGFAYPGTLARHLDFPDSPRGVLLVWPRYGEPVMVLNSFAAPLAERDSWLSTIELYDDYGGSPYAKMADVLKQMGLHDAKIGLEKTYINALHWVELQRYLAQAELVDCTAMMKKVRWIKTPGELDLIKQGARLLDEAYLEVFPTLKIGDTEREIHSRLVRSCIQKGANWAHGILNSSRNTVIYGGESSFSFQKGDVVRNDYVAYYRGYPGHQSRPVIVGAPSATQKRTYQAILDIYKRTIDQCRPGVKASAIYHFAADAFREAGFTQRMALAGHGVGAWWHQQEPYLVPTDHTILEAGMVLALEPHVNYWHLQEMILITENEPLILTDRFDIDEMLVVG